MGVDSGVQEWEHCDRDNCDCPAWGSRADQTMAWTSQALHLLNSVSGDALVRHREARMPHPPRVLASPPPSKNLVTLWLTITHY